MGATARITWLLLLSLSLLLHNVYSDNSDSQGVTSVTKDPVPTDRKPDAVVTSQSPSVAPPVTARNTVATTQKQPTVEPTKTVTAGPTAVPAIASSDPAKPVTTQPHVVPPVVTNTPTVKPTSSSGVPTTGAKQATAPPAATTLGKPNGPIPPAATTNGPVLTPTLAPVQTSKATVLAGTTVSIKPARTPDNVVTSQIPKDPTGAPTPRPGQQATTRVTVPPKTTLEDDKGAIIRTTASAQSPTPAPSKSPEPAGATAGQSGTPPLPSTTKAGPPDAAGTPGTKAGTTAAPSPISTISTIHRTTTSSTTVLLTAAQPKTFKYSLNNGDEKKEEKDLVEVCRRLMANYVDGNCTLTLRHHNGKVQFERVEVNGKVKTDLANQYYEDITKKPTDNKTLIAILASCGALLIMIVILAVCASHHRRPYNETQQHLTEELHTVENGYHDNPTLEVMEVQPEMQEKKSMTLGLNGTEFNDSWIVPMDNLTKEEGPDEEDTHL